MTPFDSLNRPYPTTYPFPFSIHMQIKPKDYDIFDKAHFHTGGGGHSLIWPKRLCALNRSLELGVKVGGTRSATFCLKSYSLMS